MKTTSTAPPGAPRAAILFFALFLVAGGAKAQVPSTINYQGRLTDNTPAQAPATGTFAMQFAIFGSPTGGTALWAEPASGTIPVAVNSGIFSVVLGSNGVPIPPSLFANTAALYLEIVIDSETLTPRQVLTATGWANQSAHSDDSQSLDGIAASGWQRRVASPCAPGEAIGGINADGSVVCVTGPVGPEGPAGPEGPIGVNWLGPWSAATSYVASDGVSYNGSSYIALGPNSNDPPPGTNWSLLAEAGAAGPPPPDAVVGADNGAIVCQSASPGMLQDLQPTNRCNFNISGIGRFDNTDPATPGVGNDLEWGAIAESTWGRVTPSSGPSEFWFHTRGFPNTGSPRENQVTRFGWNTGEGGGLVVQGESSLAWEFESFYQPTTIPYMEAHLAYTSPSGQNFRLFSSIIRRDTDYMAAGYSADEFTINDKSYAYMLSVIPPNRIEFRPGSVVRWGQGEAQEVALRSEPGADPVLLVQNGSGNASASLRANNLTLFGSLRFNQGGAVLTESGTGSLVYSSTGPELLMKFGGTTSQFPAWKRVGSGMVARLADNSGDTSVTASSFVVSGASPNSFLYSGSAGLLTTTAPPTDGQLLIGASGNPPMAASLTAGDGITVANGPGTITIGTTTLSANAILDFPSTLAGTCSDLTIPVGGAIDGDPVALGVPGGSVVTDGSFSSWVSAADTVTVRFCAAATGDPASGDFRVKVIR